MSYIPKLELRGSCARDRPIEKCWSFGQQIAGVAKCVGAGARNENVNTINQVIITAEIFERDEEQLRQFLKGSGEHKQKRNLSSTESSSGQGRSGGNRDRDRDRYYNDWKGYHTKPMWKPLTEEKKVKYEQEKLLKLGDMKSKVVKIEGQEFALVSKTEVEKEEKEAMEIAEEVKEWWKDAVASRGKRLEKELVEKKKAEFEAKQEMKRSKFLDLLIEKEAAKMAAREDEDTDMDLIEEDEMRPKKRHRISDMTRSQATEESTQRDSSQRVVSKKARAVSMKNEGREKLKAIEGDSEKGGDDDMDQLEIASSSTTAI